MKCLECRACHKGWFKSKPNDYVCTGVPEPFIIEDVHAECTEYKFNREAKPDIKTEDRLVLGFSRTQNDDACLAILRVDGENIVVVNTLFGERALDAYKELVGVD